MKVLIVSGILEDWLLGRQSDVSSSVQQLFNTIYARQENPRIQPYITIRCFKNLIDIKQVMLPDSEEKDLYDYLKRFQFKIGEISRDILEKARRYDLDFESALEIECGRELKVDAIVTHLPQKYTGIENSIPIWTIENFLHRYRLDRAYSSNAGSYSRERYQQLSLWPEKKKHLSFMIRNTIPVILLAVKILKAEGFKGISRNDFSNKLGKTEKTTQSIILDLEKFQIASYSRNRVTVHPDLLDTGESDIANYLHEVLKDHILVQEIYKSLEIEKVITQWRLQEIMQKINDQSNLLNSKEDRKDKTLSDYRSRFTSWILFANLLQSYKRNGITHYTIPSSTTSPKTSLDSEVYQLELPLNIA
ncbi:hypothetical protein V0288_17460 [Pannus brasiliensis CCIBt3594]|uniref:Uncharacterized protein n=1 Tax=Pannus brasiliensis CCIBt3594 TaxID=1427578 RepID=A0AAW9QUW3_9CHRO